MADLLHTERHGRVALVAFNRPDRHNALNDELFAAWRRATAEAIGDPDVGCLVLAGEGPSFSSGRDTTVLGHRAGGETDMDFVRDAQQANQALLASPKPVVAALHGHVIGGALEIALAADVRIAADTTRMRLPEIRFGLLPDTGASQLLTRLAGPARAKLMIMTGREVDAATALAWGLVEQVVDPHRVRGEALALAASLTEARPEALAMAKQLVDAGDAGAVQRAFAGELTAQTALFALRRQAGG